MGVDTTYMDAFFKGLPEGANAGDSKKKAAYYAGIQMGQQIAQQWIPGLSYEIFGEDSTRQVSLQNLLAGFVSGASGKNCLMTADEAAQTMQTMMQTVKAKVMAEKYGDWKKECEDYMAGIAKKEGIKELGDGVYYEVITEGDGAVPEDTSTVEVRYAGTLIDGTEFDSNMKADLPMKFQANQVIPGWREALTHMPAGSTWKVYIPADMAYGENQAGEKIKPFSTLVFTIQLIK